MNLGALLTPENFLFCSQVLLKCRPVEICKAKYLKAKHYIKNLYSKRQKKKTILVPQSMV